ncbi:hypothetical protein [Stieleria varia]|uniref:Uncharacterized protein n=1 Tax=Stieleria varia TaxID=2528005 RepID=A0A5C6B0Q8_9BACT|nr:hypothetical protein [Stieleria varia]TWU05039.1 hypothetical protein Pla52n_30850 [Stieleria varia]
MKIPSSHRSVCSLLISGFLAVCVGCGEPIYHAVDYQRPSLDIKWSEPSDSSRYEWPLKRQNYIVTKPPPMAYLTSFSEKFSFDNVYEEPLVPWDDLPLGDEAKAFLAEIYDPLPTQLETSLTIDPNEMTGDQAFDLSLDGKRLVLLRNTQLVLYNTETNKRIGSMPLPGDWSSAPPHAVRFCGRSKDFLVASTKQICRISGKDGQISSQVDGCNASIVRWDITPNDDAMVLLSDEGKIYLGHPDLTYFSPANVEDRTYTDVAITEDASHAIAVSESSGAYFSHILNTKDHRVTEFHTIDAEVVHKAIRVVGGLNADAWLDQATWVVALERNKEGSDEKENYLDLRWGYWRPHLAVSCTRDEKTNWFLTVGMRIINDQAQWILFDFGPKSRNHSVAIPLQEKPRRMVASRNGGLVVLLDSAGLHLHPRRAWRSPRRIDIPELGYAVVRTADVKQIELLYEALGRQKRWSAGKCPSELQDYLLSFASELWRSLDRKGDEISEQDKRVLQSLVQWREEGSVLSKTVSGYRHAMDAWEARGNGMSDSVSQGGWKTFEESNRKAQADLKAAVESDNPPSLALLQLTQVSLDLDGDLTAVDPLARRFVELYPDNLRIAGCLGIKLLPQWHGAPGDVVSFFTAHSKLYEGKHSDIVYALMAGRLSRHLYNDSALDWKSFDISRMMSGITEYDRQNWPVEYDMWYAKECLSRLATREQNEQMLRYLMKSVAVFPVVDKNTFWYTRDTVSVPKQIFDDVLARENKSP